MRLLPIVLIVLLNGCTVEIYRCTKPEVRPDSAAYVDSILSRQPVDGTTTRFPTTGKAH